MIPLSVPATWLFLAALVIAGWNLAKHLARWLYEADDERRDLESLDRHHGARAACSRVGQGGTRVLPPRSVGASNPCPATQQDEPVDWDSVGWA